RGADAELHALPDDLTEVAADDRAADRTEDRADLVFRRFARLGRTVPECDVADLVGHHPRDLAFTVRRLEHAAVDEHRSAGQREGVDLADVDPFERVLEFRM